MRMTQVTSVTKLSPHMTRIVLGGNDLKDFPTDKNSAHVKAIFPNPKATDGKPKLGMYIGFKKWMRSYTIRDFNAERFELTLDFAVHDHKGLASNWAENAKVGDYLGIAGPGETKHTNLNAKDHLFIGDLTALPAIAATLEDLPTNAIGSAWIQVPTSSDIQQIQAPSGIALNWIVTSDKLTPEFGQALATQRKDLSETAIFIAAEASVVKALKSQLNDNHDYNKKNLYASAYWNQKR
ncbi:siderophore-interacting protein [Psychrosphaera haliotis]|nr:siderophore-interacting protein [Psychrosphaera haliotis]